MKITAAFDPVTRLEGHLNLEITIDAVDGVQQVVNTKAIGSLFRGFEKLLISRDPRDAQHITQRICGVCPVAHSHAAVRALDQAFNVTPPNNGRILRNLTNGANFLESHILHFYLLSLPDYMAGPSMPPWQVDWTIDRRLSEADTRTLMQHYLQAIDMRRKGDQLTAIFGGRSPHPPAFVPGGFTANARPERIALFKQLLNEITTFIETSYLPDIERLAQIYDDYHALGVGHKNLLAFGAFDLDTEEQVFRPGVARQGRHEIDDLNADHIHEHVHFSWFRPSDPAHPASARTEPQHPKQGAYTWLKAPRYQGAPYEVGPLARMWINGDYQQGISAMDRHRARAYEAAKLANLMKTWIDQLEPQGSVYTPSSVPKTATSVGFTEAPRGALGHWLQIHDSKISRYQVISPTTWNVSPRDDAGVPGPLEQALLGTPVQDADKPIEVMRVIHSFDPCLDCATHVMRPGQKAHVYRIR